MQWLELTIQTTSRGIDALGARLTALGYDSFIIDDETDFDEFLEHNRQYWDYVDEDLTRQMAGKSQIRLYLEDGPTAPETVTYLRGELDAFRRSGGPELGSLELTVTPMQDEDWENNWKQYYQPLSIGRQLLVVPKWMAELDPKGRIPIYLDPGMIFGTGAHASTQMCMQALEQAVFPGCRVVDLGSGSGILSITALLLGAATATGVDIDPKAEDIARENAALNGLGPDRFSAVTGDVIADRSAMEQLAEGGYDLVLANIVADVILPLAPVVPHFLRPGAKFICSGILETRASEVLDALQQAGLTVTAQNRMDDWCCYTAMRSTDV